MRKHTRQQRAWCAALVALMLLFGLAACGGNPTPTARLINPTATLPSIPTPTAPTTAGFAAAADPPTAESDPQTVAPALPTPTLAAPDTVVGALSTATPGSDENLDVPLPASDAPTPNPRDLPRLNGVPKLPLINTALTSLQPPPPPLQENFGPNNTPRIGIQIGHYEIDQLPDEFKSLRTQTGGSGGGVQEVEVNAVIARQVAALLTAKGAMVDVLPATVPIAYTADAFIAIHADASSSGNPRGYKLAPSRFSAIPQTDAALASAISDAYASATHMPLDNNITRNMTGYYAFNSRRRLHSVSKITPAVIIETGYLTNATDRAVLTSSSDSVSEGIANGIWQFIQNRPPVDQREKPQNRAPALTAALENTPVYASAAGGKIIAYVAKGQRFEYYENRGAYASVFLPILRVPGYILKSDTTVTSVPR